MSSEPIIKPIKFDPVSVPLRVPIVDGSIDIGNLVAQLVAQSIAPSALAGQNELYLGIFYDLKVHQTGFDPRIANMRTGRYNLPCTIYMENGGPRISVTDADIEGIKKFLVERAQLEKESEGNVREYANAIMYQAQ